jgi:four helix bundle protein
MGTIQSFEELEVWKKAREFAKSIYDISQNNTLSKDFELKNQMNRSSGSVMDNIAEGFERGGNKEFVQFLAIAKGSVGETRSQLYRALDREHIEKETFETLKSEALSISKMLSSLINYLKSSEIKGVKFKDEKQP